MNLYAQFSIGLWTEVSIYVIEWRLELDYLIWNAMEDFYSPGVLEIVFSIGVNDMYPVWDLFK